jgi:hypothetical protein
MTRQELAAQVRHHGKRSNRVLFIWTLTLGLWMVGGALLDSLLNWGGSTVFRQAYVVLGVVVFFVYLLVLGGSSGLRGVPCPHCKKRLFGISGQIAVATGICGYCGEKAFE